jgi:dihydroneopterin aldolase
VSKIAIADLEVFCRVGVPRSERAKPQRLLLTIEMDFNLAKAAKSDDVRDTIDYYAVCELLADFTGARSWKLMEKLAADVADLILFEFKPRSVTVEVKKFPVPQAKHVSAQITRKR